MANENAQLIEMTGTRQENEAVLKIAKMAQEKLINDRKISISMSEAIPTIVHDFLYCVAQYLDKNKSTSSDVNINLMNLIEMGVTFRESDDGEKDGNFVPYIVPGTIFKTLIKSDEMTEDDE